MVDSDNEYWLVKAIATLALTLGSYGSPPAFCRIRRNVGQRCNSLASEGAHCPSALSGSGKVIHGGAGGRVDHRGGSSGRCRTAGLGDPVVAKSGPGGDRIRHGRRTPGPAGTRTRRAGGGPEIRRPNGRRDRI